MTTKICSQCGEEKPATTEYFNKWTRSKCGLRAYCKMCEKRIQQRILQKERRKTQAKI